MNLKSTIAMLALVCAASTGVAASAGVQAAGSSEGRDARDAARPQVTFQKRPVR